MEKAFKRLAKYALDPDNKREYLARRDEWHKKAEKWHAYHEKQLAKAEKSGIIYSKKHTLKIDLQLFAHIPICTAWIRETPDSEHRLVSAYVTAKEVTS